MTTKHYVIKGQGTTASRVQIQRPKYFVAERKQSG
jgi:hypothetical protein